MIVLYVLIFIVVVSIFYGVGIYNRLVKLSTLVAEAWLVVVTFFILTQVFFSFFSNRLNP